MKNDVWEFQEEIASLADIEAIKKATKAAMERLDLPHFIYAWTHSPYLDRLDLFDDSVFHNISEEFYRQYTGDGLFQHDVLIHALRGTLSNPRLGRRTLIKWWTIPAELVGAKSVIPEELSMEYFSAGVTKRFENYQKIFVAGASIIAQDQPEQEFWQAFEQHGEAAFAILRIYHDTFHDLRRETTPASIYQREHWEIAQAIRHGNVQASDEQVRRMLHIQVEHEADVYSPTPPFEHTPQYDVIRIRGVELKLGLRQAGIIRHLHELHKNGTPWIFEKDLLSLLSGKSDRLKDAFNPKKFGILFRKDPIKGVCLNI